MRIRDPWIFLTLDPESGMEKIRIRDKHPRFATLLSVRSVHKVSVHYTTPCGFLIWMRFVDSVKFTPKGRDNLTLPPQALESNHKETFKLSEIRVVHPGSESATRTGFLSVALQRYFTYPAEQRLSCVQGRQQMNFPVTIKISKSIVFLTFCPESFSAWMWKQSMFVDSQNSAGT